MAHREKSTCAVSKTHVTEQKKLVDNEELTYYVSADFCIYLNLEEHYPFLQSFLPSTVSMGKMA